MAAGSFLDDVLQAGTIPESKFASIARGKEHSMRAGKPPLQTLILSSYYSDIISGATSLAKLVEDLG